MTSVMEATRARSADTAGATTGLVDCDTHNYWKSPEELKPFLAKRWIDQLAGLGARHYQGGYYPRFWGDPLDTSPVTGRRPGSDVHVMATEHLDRHDISYAILIPLTSVGEMANLEFASALARAVNEWQVEYWLDPEPRMRASLVVATEDPIEAAAEIRRAAVDRRFVQVQFSGRAHEPMGRRRYWPIYEACAEFGLAVMTHAFGNAGNPITGAGWASYYVEDHVGPAQSVQANVVSMVMEGVFERFPGLRMLSVESGFGWAPSLAWRMDSAFELLGSEVQHLKRLPSEYMADHVYMASQPVEEPHSRSQFQELFEQYPAFRDRLVFSSDYPHWDRDNPGVALPHLRDRELRDRVLRHNARQLYRLA